MGAAGILEAFQRPPGHCHRYSRPTQPPRAPAADGAPESASILLAPLPPRRPGRLCAPLLARRNRQGRQPPTVPRNRRRSSEGRLGIASIAIFAGCNRQERHGRRRHPRGPPAAARALPSLFSPDATAKGASRRRCPGIGVDPLGAPPAAAPWPALRPSARPTQPPRAPAADGAPESASILLAPSRRGALAGFAPLCSPDATAKGASRRRCPGIGVDPLRAAWALPPSPSSPDAIDKRGMAAAGILEALQRPPGRCHRYSRPTQPPRAPAAGGAPESASILLAPLPPRRLGRLCAPLLARRNRQGRQPPTVPRNRRRSSEGRLGIASIAIFAGCNRQERHGRRRHPRGPPAAARALPSLFSPDATAKGASRRRCPGIGVDPLSPDATAKGGSRRRGPGIGVDPLGAPTAAASWPALRLFQAKSPCLGRVFGRIGPYFPSLGGFEIYSGIM